MHIPTNPTLAIPAAVAHARLQTEPASVRAAPEAIGRQEG